MKSKLKPPGTKHLKLKCDELPSCFAFKFKLRRYTVAKNGKMTPQDAKWRQHVAVYSAFHRSALAGRGAADARYLVLRLPPVFDAAREASTAAVDAWVGSGEQGGGSGSGGAGGGAAGRAWQIRVHSLNNIPSHIRILVVQEDLSSVRGNFRRFCSILGDFSVDTLPKHTQF